MRWFCIRRAKIDQELRKSFEMQGAITLQTALGTNRNYFVHKGKDEELLPYRGSLLLWLTEQFDTEELKQTWSLTMEFLITAFVAVELPWSKICSLLNGLYVWLSEHVCR